MRRPRDAAAIFALALAFTATAGEPFERFARRLGLHDTLRAWQIDRLEMGTAPVRREAARALSVDGSLLASATLSPAERRDLLKRLVAALPVDDAAGARARLELARQALAEASVQVDALRGGEPGPAAAAPARASLAQAAELIDPILDRRAVEPRRSDPLAAARDAAWLLDAWRVTLSAWLDRREGATAGREPLRAVALFAGLLDAPLESPTPAQASVDLLRGELGADAALGLATALQLAGDAEGAQEWLRALERSAPTTQAARRASVTRLAFAIDARDPVAMRAAIDAMPARSLPASLAAAAARAAARTPGPDATAVISAALDAMDADTRADWLGRLGDAAGPLQPLASALARASARSDAWRKGSGDPAEAASIARELDAALASSAALAPPVLRGEALRLRGFALRAAGDGPAASAAFEAAAAESAALRGECLWLAALTEPAADAAGAARRIDLLRRQREADPDGPFAGRAATWLSRLGAFAGDALAAAVLMEVREDDPFVADARAEAARRMLEAAGTDPRLRKPAGRRALEALGPYSAQAGIARWRLAAAIAADDLAEARQAERDLAAVDRADPAVAAAVAWIDLLRGDAPGARAAIEALPVSQREAAASAACARLASMQGAEARVAEVELACLAAQLVPTAGVGAARERLAQSVLRAADASVDLPAPLAVRAFGALSDAPGATRAQRGALGESLRMAGRASEAIEPLQSLGASFAQGSEPWAEARWRLYRCLLAVDADRAAAMLRQHMALAPDGGPPPWGERFVRAAGGGRP